MVIRAPFECLEDYELRRASEEPYDDNFCDACRAFAMKQKGIIDGLPLSGCRNLREIGDYYLAVAALRELKESMPYWLRRTV